MVLVVVLIFSDLRERPYCTIYKLSCVYTVRSFTRLAIYGSNCLNLNDVSIKSLLLICAHIEGGISDCVTRAKEQKRKHSSLKFAIERERERVFIFYI